MRFFWRSRSDHDFLEALRPELRALETPSPSDGLRARILASRSAGVRTILPGAVIAPRRSTGTIAALAVAVSLLLLLVPIQLRRSASRGDDFASPGFLGLVAEAQTVNPARSPVEPVRLTGVSRLHATSLVYSRRRFNSAGAAIDTTAITLDLRDAALDGARAWRLDWLERNPLASVATRAETVYVGTADLRLLRRDIHVAPYSRFQRINVHQRFAGDSVSGRMFTEGPSIGEGRFFRRLLPSDLGPVLSETLAPLFLVAVRLDRSWSGRVSLLGWAVRDDDVLLPVELRVEGEETITVPAGRFDCWRLSLQFPGGRSDYWARKSDGLGLRILARDAGTHGTREIVLAKEN